MSDLISRQQAIDALRAMQTYKLFAGDDMLLIDQAGAMTELMQLPPIQPEPHWIPVTEPPKSDFMPYYATCRSKVDDRENWVIEGMYTKYSGWEYPPMVRDDRAEIIAWMPKELPEPYKGVTT